jgi:leucyl/phenylalanyl-tRNA--protein transferase
MYILTDDILFPDVHQANEDGLLAIGGDLGPRCLMEAYRRGIFPWFNEDEPICWWSPDPRCVLFPLKLKVSKSMHQLINRKYFSFTYNQQFEAVIKSCATVNRNGAKGTWIHDSVISAYSKLHAMGHAVSGEAWRNGKLVGGMYGVKIGKIFFGESMFSEESNASKFAFIHFVRHQLQEGLQMIDCQMETSHLLSLGAEMISRGKFINILNEYCSDGQVH